MSVRCSFRRGAVAAGPGILGTWKQAGIRAPVCSSRRTSTTWPRAVPGRPPSWPPTPPSTRLAADRTTLVPGVQPYRPGEFWLRELPPLRAGLDGLTGMALLVIDGYVDLDPDGRPGLGARARARDEFGVPVIGVAKSPFRTATHAISVLRGTSARPLYVTAAGIPRRRSLPRPTHGRPLPYPRCPPPRRHPRPPWPASTNAALNETAHNSAHCR
jgi:hypothetical protein